MPLDKMVLLCLQGHFVGDPLRDTSKTFIFMSRCNCCPFLIYIVGILTHRHHAYFAEAKFVLPHMFLEHVLWPRLLHISS